MHVNDTKDPVFDICGHKSGNFKPFHDLQRIYSQGRRNDRFDVSAHDVDNGCAVKVFHVHDGVGIKLLQKQGIKVAILTARQSTMVALRASELGIDAVFQGQSNKADVLDTLSKRLHVPLQRIAYVGDDLADLVIMRRVGFAIAVANAVPAIKEAAHWTTTVAGGHGAVREISEFILSAQGKLTTALDPCPS